MIKKRIFLLFVLSLFSLTLCQASYYYWNKAIISGKDYASDDPGTVIIPDFSHPYGVAVAGNGRVWTASYYKNDSYDKPIFVYDPKYESIDTIGPIINIPEGSITLGSCRFFASLENGNIAYGDWSNDRILVFDQENYQVVGISDSSYNCNVSGGIEAFYYAGVQYYLSQRIIGNEIIIWDSSFTPFDTLYGSPGGRNLAVTENGSVIISPSLGGDYFTAFRGDPLNGYELDTLYFDELGIDMGNIMYVSSGPQDYFWLFSRDSDNDGIYVVDPYNNFEIKKFTNTDPSKASRYDFPLSIAVESQYMYWLEQGLIDSSEVFTRDAGYTQPWVVRAPCQVAWDYRDGCVSLYMADFYGYTLKSWYMWPFRPFKVYASRSSGLSGDKVSIYIFAMFPSNRGYNTFNLALTGFSQYTQLLDIYPGNLLSSKNWNISYYQNNDTLYIDGSGANAVNEVGTLLYIDLLINDMVDTNNIPVNLTNILFDGINHNMIKGNGSIIVLPPTPILYFSSTSIKHDFGDIMLNHDPDPSSYKFKIYNTGNDTLIGTISSTVEWLTVSKDSFVVNEDDSIEITVTAQTSSLPLGDYSGEIKIYSNSHDVSGPVTLSIISQSKTENLPLEYRLHSNYPNPFNPITTINYALSADCQVNLSVYDMNGRMIKTLVNDYLSQGSYSVNWNASESPSGIYLLKMTAGGFTETRKMLLMK